MRRLLAALLVASSLASAVDAQPFLTDGSQIPVTADGITQTLSSWLDVSHTDTLVFNGADSAGNKGAFISATLSGTTTSYQSAAFEWIVTADQANAPNGFIDDFQWQCFAGGANFGGIRDCGHTVMAWGGTPTQTRTGTDLVSMVNEGYATTGWGGTAGYGNAVGNLTGTNQNVRLTSNTSYWNILAGDELDITDGGAPGLFRKYGLFLVEGGNDTTGVTGEDAWIISVGETPAVGFSALLRLGSSIGYYTQVPNGNDGLSATGSIVTISNPSTNLGYGIDLRNGIFSGAAFASPGFSVGPSGALTAASYSAGASAGVTCSGTPTASFAVTNGIVTHC